MSVDYVVEQDNKIDKIISLIYLSGKISWEITEQLPVNFRVEDVAQLYREKGKNPERRLPNLCDYL